MPSWIHAVIKKKLRPVTYEVQLFSGGGVKRHLDQLRKGGKNIRGDGQTQDTDKENVMPESGPWRSPSLMKKENCNVLLLECKRKANSV